MLPLALDWHAPWVPAIPIYEPCEISCSAKCELSTNLARAFFQPRLHQYLLVVATTLRVVMSISRLFFFDSCGLSLVVPCGCCLGRHDMHPPFQGWKMDTDVAFFPCDWWFGGANAERMSCTRSFSMVLLLVMDG